MPQTGQQHYLSHPPRRNGRNGDRGSGDFPGNGRHPHRSSWHGGPHGTPDGGYGGPPDDPYGGGTGSPSSSEFGRWCRHDQCSWQHYQFEQSMIAMNDLWINLLNCQQRTQDDTTHNLKVIHQSQRYHANDCLVNTYIPMMENLYYILTTF